MGDVDREGERARWERKRRGKRPRGARGKKKEGNAYILRRFRDKKVGMLGTLLSFHPKTKG